MDERAKQALNQFLDIYGNNQTNAAIAVGYTSQRLNQLCTGRREISEAVAARIHALTNGDISMFDLSINLRRLQHENV